MKRLSILIYLILLIISVVTIGTVISLNILPIKYLISIIGIYILVLVIIGLLVFKVKNNIIKVLFTIISIIIIILLSFTLYYINKTLNFVDSIGSKDYQLEEYYILVLKENNYNNLKDLNHKTLGIYQNNLENYNNSLSSIKEEVEVKEESYNNYIDATDALLDKKIDSLLINASYKSIIDDEYKDFNNKVKILKKYQYKIDNKIKQEEVSVVQEPFNIYISGIDIYGDISLVSRSDVNMIITVNPNTHKILLTSIPRDYYVQLHGTNGYKDKLTHSGIYGINMTIETIEDLLDIDINYYIRVNFNTLIDLVDTIGGIDVYSDQSFTAHTNKNCTYQRGEMHLDGKCALAFSRERYSYIEGDRHRVKNQQDVVIAIINKALNSKTLITKYGDILKSLSSSFQTNIPNNKIYNLINMQLDTMPTWDIEQISLSGSDSSNYTYSYPNQKLYVMEPDINTIISAKEKIKEVENN